MTGTLENTRECNNPHHHNHIVLRQAYLLWLRVMPLTNCGDLVRHYTYLSLNVACRLVNLPRQCVRSS